MSTNSTYAPICYTCQTSLGLSPADQKSIIIMVVLTGVALISCYIGVLWYAIRTRDKSTKDPIIESMTKNEAYSHDEDLEDYMSNTPTNRGSTAALLPTQKSTDSIGK